MSIYYYYLLFIIISMVLKIEIIFKKITTKLIVGDSHAGLKHVFVWQEAQGFNVSDYNAAAISTLEWRRFTRDLLPPPYQMCVSVKAQSPEWESHELCDCSSVAWKLH